MLPGSKQRDRSPPSNLKANYEPQEQGGGMEAGLETAQSCTPGHWLQSTQARPCIPVPLTHQCMAALGVGLREFELKPQRQCRRPEET